MKLSKCQVARFTFLAGCLLVACETPEDEFKGTIPLEIKEVSIPESGQVNGEVPILAYVEATNGCFKDLKIMLRQVGSQHYLLRATSFFESSNTCPAAMVSLDTTIIFKPTFAGEYYFQTNEDPFVVYMDTLIVN